jgi:hypothetical protein
VKAGELDSSTDCDELAHFLYANLHGAILQSKVEHSPAPMKRFKKTFFAAVLRPAPPRSQRATRPRASFRIGAERTSPLTINTDVRIIPSRARPGFALRRNELPEAVGLRSGDGPISFSRAPLGKPTEVAIWPQQEPTA